MPGIATEVLANGGRNTLVLLHPLGDDARCWPGAVRRWGGSHRIVGVDARGHGRSARFDDDELARAGDVLVDDVDSVLDDLAVAASGPLIAVAHSLGAASLAAVLARRPDAVRAAVLIDPPWIDPVAPDVRRTLAAEKVAWVQRLLAAPAQALGRVRRRHPRWADDELAAYLDAFTRLDLRFLGSGEGLSSGSWADQVAAIRTPTLVVAGGGEGALVGAATRARLAELANPSIDVRVVEGAGHDVRQDQPDEFHAVVDPFLAIHAV